MSPLFFFLCRCGLPSNPLPWKGAKQQRQTNTSNSFTSTATRRTTTQRFLSAAILPAQRTNPKKLSNETGTTRTPTMQLEPAEKRYPLPHEPITHFLPLHPVVKHDSGGSLTSHALEDSFLFATPLGSDKSTNTLPSVGDDSDFCASSLRSQIDEKKRAFVNSSNSVDPCSSFFIVELAKSRREDPLEMWNSFLQPGQPPKQGPRRPVPPTGSATRRRASGARTR